MNEHEPRRGVVIVAGGRSRRMGQDKAWLRIGDEHLLQRVVRLARGAAPFVVVVASPGQALPALPDAVRVDDPLERVGGGPVVGVLTGLEALASSHVELAYLGSVDAVSLSTRHIEHMLAVLQADPREAAVVPQTDPLEDGRSIVHGLSGAVRVPVASSTARALLDSSRGASMRELYDRLNARRLGVDTLPDPDAVRACNTPAQWHEALARLTPTAHD